MIDWTNPQDHVTAHFTVHEATYLPSWDKYHMPDEQEQANLIRLFALMEQIRSFSGAPIRVHVTIRPADYNAQVGGAPRSAHIQGLACDFDVMGQDCDHTRAALLGKLEEWNCRLENRPGSGWCHVDLYPVRPGGHRFFIP